MADKKISALTGATTPLAGTEVLPIVQGGATVNVSVANLTDGRAVAMAGGSFTDSITQSTANKGINFTANTASTGMTSQLLNYYEEVTAASAACTGAITTAVVWKATRAGNSVTLTLPTTTGTAVAVPGLFFRYGVSLPTTFRPSADLGFPCVIKDNAANLVDPGLVYISATGTITVYKNLPTNSNFTAGVLCGLGQTIGISLSWSV
jgi:hypothetical protein